MGEAMNAIDLQIFSLVRQLSNQTYTGQVATHCFCPGAKTGSQNQIMSRTYHVATDDMKSVRLVYSNWYGSENKLGAALTITASIEYPVGIFTQVKFSGAAAGTISDGSNLISDPVVVAIPQGSPFFVRQYCVNPSATGIVYSSYLQNQTLGEAMLMAASGVADQTMGGTIAPNFANTLYGPSAIIGDTRRASVLVVGDSRAAGANEDHATISTETGQITPSLFPAIGYMNMAIAGEQAQNFVQKHIYRAPFGMYATHIICEYGINDLILGSRTYAQVLADLQTIRGYFAKQKFYQATILPKSLSTDGWATVGNQTADPLAAPRSALNNTFRGGASWLNGYFETADAVESARDSGLWKAPGYTADGLHGTTQAYQGAGGIVASGAINPAVLIR